MMKKAQTATEYLIILAVVIIIALIVVGVMGGIPGMGGGSKQKASAAYWSTAKIAFTSYSVRPAGVTLKLRNNNLESVTLNSVSLNSVNMGITPQTLTTGETATFTAGGINCTSGSYSYTVRVNYTDTGTGSSYIFTGDGQTLDGTCATG
jgi:uncharacterized protein (UPF0333 family)